jgi:RNA chaperone Hfq
MNTYDQERTEQLREGARLARHDDTSVPSSRTRLSINPARRPAKAAAAPKGHEAFLKALHESGAEIAVYCLDMEAPIVGKIRATDKYTISLDVRGSAEVIFKHAIQRFKPLPRPRVQTPEEGAAA